MAARFVDPLIIAERESAMESRLVTARNKSGVSEAVIPYDLGLGNIPGLPFAFARIIGLLWKFKPRIVISHNTRSSLLPLLAARLLCVKVRIYFNHGVPYAGYGGVLRLLLLVIERLNCSLATSVVTVSEDMAALLKTIAPRISPRMILNGSACGIDLAVFGNSSLRQAGWRQHNRIKETDIVIVFVGRAEKRKGFDLVLQLWRDYFPAQEFKLVLCGPVLSDVLHFMPEVPENVICLGFAENIPEVLANADALILPSLHEGMPYAVLEAMASGCIVCVNDIEGPRNVVQNGVNGYLVEGNRLTVYASLIHALAKGGTEFEEVRREARKTAELFSRERFLPEYLKFLRELGSCGDD